jgi:hypothetical protein
MGSIDATLNTGLAVGWQATPWLSMEGKATLPLTDSQGSYQASVTLIPVQNNQDTVAFQSAALFSDGRYLNTVWGQRAAEPPHRLSPLCCAGWILWRRHQPDLEPSVRCPLGNGSERGLYLAGRSCE